MARFTFIMLGALCQSTCGPLSQTTHAQYVVLNRLHPTCDRLPAMGPQEQPVTGGHQLD